MTIASRSPVPRGREGGPAQLETLWAAAYKAYYGWLTDRSLSQLDTDPPACKRVIDSIPTSVSGTVYHFPAHATLRWRYNGIGMELCVNIVETLTIRYYSSDKLDENGYEMEETVKRNVYGWGVAEAVRDRLGRAQKIEGRGLLSVRRSLGVFPSGKSMVVKRTYM